ncbi:MAG: PepSY-associated TM helix domain-containing protein [Sulfurimonas sp.]|nr:PepSY-associated TM helix domain-containing protein [Sulfurimonas sp.]
MKKRTQSLFHKLHLYLGLFAALTLSIVGLTGAILSYEKEILRLLNPSSFEVKIQEKKLPMQTLVSEFFKQKPEAQIRMISIAKDPQESYVFRIASKKSRKGEAIYLNPYTGEILPQVRGTGFFHFIENLHRRLAMGEVGKQIVGASVLMLIVIVLSGIIISLPRIKRGFFASFSFNPKAKGRALLYSMHAALGMWVIPFYLVVSLTGLYWSYKWYNSALYALAGVEKPQRAMHKKPQTQEPHSPEDVAQNAHKALELFESKYGECYSSAVWFVDAKKYKWIFIDSKPAHLYARNEIIFDAKNGTILEHSPYDAKTIGGKLMASILALHTGEYFGWIGQLGMFLAALCMPLFGITGLLLYLKKRKKKREG